MFDQHEFTDLSNRLFEDPEDMLDHAYEKLSEALLFYVEWCKIFCEGADSHQIREELLSQVKEQYEFLDKYLMVRVDEREEGRMQIRSSIRSSGKKACEGAN